MALLTVQTADRGGLNLTDSDVAASAGGDSFANDGNTALYVLNGSGGDITVTLVFGTGAAVDGQSPTNRTVVVEAGKAEIIGPFPTQYYNDGNGRMNVTYSGVTTLTVLPFKLSTT